MSERLAPPRILCQPDPTKSCGACCGMYNHAGDDAAATMARLVERTRAYRDEADIDDHASLQAFRGRWEFRGEKHVGGLPNCPFLGLLDDRRVGCLVHPLQNGGVDGRDCGVYDRHTCEDYLCAAHAVLRPIEKWLVVAACADSYTYGLVVSDPLFVRQLFEQTAALNHTMPTAAHVVAGKAAAARYFGLKRDFPYRASDGVLGQVSGSPGLETPRRLGPSERLGTPPDRWESILRCLGCEVRTADELDDARGLVEAAVRAFADAVAL